MSGISGKIESETNLIELAKLLKELPENFARNEVKKAQKAAWQVVLNAARAQCPVDSGELRESIIMKVGYSKKRGEVFAVVGLTTTKKTYAKSTRRRLKSNKKHYFVIDAYYGRFVEFGTEHQKPQPFMRHAFDNNFREAFHEFGTALETGLEARFKRMAKQAIKRRIS